MTARRISLRVIGSVGLMVALLWSYGAMAEQLGQGGGTEISIWRVVAALGLCLALAIGGILALRARLRGSGTLVVAKKGQLQLVDTLRLSHQVDICVVRYKSCDLVIAIHPQGVIFSPAACQAERKGDTP